MARGGDEAAVRRKTVLEIGVIGLKYTPYEANE